MSSWFRDIDLEQSVILGSLESLTPIAWSKIRSSYNSLKKALSATESDLINLGLTSSQVFSLINRPKSAKGQLRILDRHNIKFINLDDSNYPFLLKQIPDPPLWLYYQGGNLNDYSNFISVVGTRKPSIVAKNSLNKLFPTDLVSQLTTVSGLAYGIDSQVHQISLNASGSTVAVLAGGLDDIYPSEHINLSKKIINSGGALISEYPPLVRPKPYRFPVRNRIIAGLSKLTVIVEAALQSGTMTTAKSAIDYNRDLFVVPTDINRKSAEGNLRLLESGATALTRSELIYDYFSIPSSKSSSPIDSRYQKILDLIIDEALTVEQISCRSNTSIEKILAILTDLELNQTIYQPRFGYYQYNNDKKNRNRRKSS